VCPAPATVARRFPSVDVGSRVANDLALHNEGTALVADGCSQTKCVVAECAEFAAVGS